MSKKLVADLIVDYLERRDVEYVFGLCGHTVIGMLDALSRSKKLKFVNTRMRPLPPPRPTAMPASPTRPLWSCATWAPPSQTS